MKALIECSFYLKIFEIIMKCFPFPGVDFKMKTLEIDGIKVRIQIWYGLFFSNII